MLITLFFLALIQGLVSSQNESSDYLCYEKSKMEEVRNSTDLIPSGEQVLALCPHAKSVMDCQIEGLSLPEEEYRLARLKSEKKVIDDICDEDSRLHKGYVKSVDCYRSMLDEWPVCKEIAQDLYTDYRKFISSVEITDDEELDEEEEEYRKEYLENLEPICLQHSYAVACIGIKILETCGTEAHDTFVELALRTEYVRTFCGENGEYALRNEFFNFLSTEKDHAQMDTIHAMFNFELK